MTDNCLTICEHKPWPCFESFRMPCPSFCSAVVHRLQYLRWTSVTPGIWDGFWQQTRGYWCKQDFDKKYSISILPNGLPNNAIECNSWVQGLFRFCCLTVLHGIVVLSITTTVKSFCPIFQNFKSKSVVLWMIHLVADWLGSWLIIIIIIIYIAPFRH